jgi:glutaminyl-tRNA synthetase
MDTRSGCGSTRRVKGTVHWVEATHAVPMEVRLYDRLFTVPDPEDVGEDESFLDRLNPKSRIILKQAVAEHSLRNASAGDRFQFERQGYFIADSEDSTASKLVFNRTITLRDTWARISDEASAPTGERKTKRTATKRTDDSGDSTSAAGSAATTEMTAEHRLVMDGLKRRWGIADDDAAQLAIDDRLRSFFEEAAGASEFPRSIANWVIHEVQRERKSRSLAELPITPSHIVELVDLIEDGTLSGRLAKEVFAAVLETGTAPRIIVAEQNLAQIDDESALATAATEVIGAFPDRVDAYRGGKVGLLGFFVGQVMKKTDGRANPGRVRELLEGLLAEGTA